MKGMAHKFQLLNCLCGKGDLTFPYFKDLKSKFNNNGREFNYQLILRLEYTRGISTLLYVSHKPWTEYLPTSKDTNSKCLFIGCLLLVKNTPYRCT